MAYSVYEAGQNGKVDMVADTTADVASLPTDVAPGSTCLIVATGAVYALSPSKEWKVI